MAVAWDQYLTVSDPTGAFRACSRRCKTSSEKHRSRIERIVDPVSPRTVACLGAGVLNDIPYPQLVRLEVKLHLVDWLAGAPESEVSSSIISIDEEGSPGCLYCDQPRLCPEQFCSNYREPKDPSVQVCNQFVSRPGEPETCEAFVKGELPEIHCEDVSGGYAGEFGRRWLDELRHVKTWEQAFSKASRLAKRLSKHRRPLSIPDSSVDLVTSSMLVSQFAHEPYEYFSLRTAEHLGSPTAAEDDRLADAVKRLRTELLTNQVHGHFDEIERILAPNGACYLSFEMFHRIAETRQWFLFDGVPQILEAAGERFLFNCDLIPEEEWLSSFQTDSEPSLVFSLVLQANNAA